MKLALMLLLAASVFGQDTPKGSKSRITSRSKDGYCDIRGDCWWRGKYCHGCGVSETQPLFIGEFRAYLADELKRGTVIYAPPVKKPTWDEPLKETN